VSVVDSETEWKPFGDWSAAWLWSVYESRHWRGCRRVQDWRKEPHRHGGMSFSRTLDADTDWPELFFVF